MKMIKQIFIMDSFMKLNGFLYYLSLFPLIGNVVSRIAIFNEQKTKFIASVIIFFIKNILIIVLKILLSFLFVIVPVSFLSLRQIIPAEALSHFYMQLFILFFCFLGAFQESKIFTSSKQKYSFFKFFNAPPKIAILSSLKLQYYTQFISMIVVCSVCQFFYGTDIVYWMTIWILYVSCHMLGEVLYLYCFKNAGIILSKERIYSLSLFAIVIIGFSYPNFVNNPVFIADIITHPISIFIMLLLAIFSYMYIKRYDHFDCIVDIYLNPDELLSVSIRKSYAKELEAAMIDSFDEMTLSNHQKQGIDLLDFIFNIRFKKLLLKPMKIRTIILFLITLATILYYFLEPSNGISNLVGKLHHLVAISPLVLFPFAYGENYCRISYNNCDSKLLNYPFYTTRKTLFSIAKKRLKFVLIKNIQISSVLLCCYLSLLMILGHNPLDSNRVFFMLTLVALLLTYGVHHIAVYLGVQPYSIDNIAVNPIIAITQIITLMISFILMNIPLEETAMAILILIWCIIYTLGLLTFIFVRMPKKFVSH